MNRGQILQQRIKALVLLFVFGLVLSGVTAIPLQAEIDWLVRVTGTTNYPGAPAWSLWLMKVQTALNETHVSHPFFFYGTDWLAFGHFAIAIAFVGAWRDPVRNRWLFDFGLIACGLVIPYALVFGSIRGIPIWWRLIDCSFGVVGALPLWFCRRWSRELEMFCNLARESFYPS